MDLFLNSIVEGTKMCFDPLLMLIILIGVVWGVIVGALPAIGPTLGVAIALPFTFSMPVTYAIPFLIAINVADSYGNSIPAILIGVPGGGSTVLTAIDGYALHKQGKSGLALAVQYYSAIIGAFVGNFFFLMMVVPLSQLTYIFLTPEMFALLTVGMVSVTAITGDNIVKGMLSVVAGIVVSLIGQDPVSAVLRFNYTVEMRQGLEIAAVIMGCIAVAEIFRQFRQSYNWGELVVEFEQKFPPLRELWKITPHVFIGTCIGMLVGSIPGMGGTSAAFISYNQAKLWSKHPELYGHGSVEGVASNEAAQNAAQCGELIPVFGLGIPGSSTMVILFAALLMNGFVPGPMLIQHSPQLLYSAWGPGLLAPTIMLAIIGWPICRMLLKVVVLDRQLILGGSLALCMIGVFSLNRSIFDVFVMIFFGGVGYFMMRYGYSVAGFAIAAVLGRGLEGNLRAGLLLTDGWYRFLTRPWTAAILCFSTALLIYGIIGTIKVNRRTAAYRRQSLAAEQAKDPVSRAS
jgi:putative tricarboxylic transport membrane protein